MTYSRSGDDKLRAEVLKRDGYRCRYCGSTQEPFHLDHVYPYSKGGETSADNLVTSCANCNQKKHNKIGIWPLPIGGVQSVNKDELAKSYILIFFSLWFISTSVYLYFKYPGNFIVGDIVLMMFGWVFIIAGLKLLYKYL